MAKVIWKGEAVRSLGAVLNPQACDAAKTQQQQAGQARTNLLGVKQQLQSAILEAAQNGEDTSSLQSQLDAVSSQIDLLTASIVKYEGDIAYYCQEQPATPPPGPAGPECSDTKPCAAGKECVDGKCVDKCPAGYTRDASGVCKLPTPTSGGPSSMSWGVVALAGAALVGLYFAIRPGSLPAPENRLDDNPRRRVSKPRARSYGQYSVLICTPRGLVAQGSFSSARRARQVAEQQGLSKYQVRKFNTRKCHVPVSEASALPITPAPVIAVRDNPLPYYSIVTCSPNGFLIRGRFKSSRIAHMVAKQAGLRKGSYEVQRFDTRDCVKPVQSNPGCAECG